MVVSVGHLCFPPRADYIDLSGNSISWTKPGFTDHFKPGVGVVRGEGGGGGEAVFGEGVPDAGVAAGGEVVPFRGGGFGGDDRVVDLIDLADQGWGG